MPTYYDADKTFRDTIEATYPALEASLAAAREVKDVDLNQIDITIAVLMRLRSHFMTQAKTTELLNKVYAAAAADFFVETICFFLMVVLQKLDPTLSVAAEKKTVPKRGKMRPDITIWRNGQVVAAIECKTQLGWNRHGWQNDFEARETRLADEAPDARLFLLVMSGSNWAGFGDDSRVGSQFFVLLDKTWPPYLTLPINKKVIVTPLEALIKTLVENLKG